MARPKKDGERFCCYLRKDLVNMIDDYSAETSIPKTAVVEKALQRYLDLVMDDESDQVQ